MNGLAGAFFTPDDLAQDLAIEVNPGRIIDLCAGIGVLAWNCQQMHERRLRPNEPGKYGSEFVCVELNPDYVAVGKKIIPEAEWICGSVFDIEELTTKRFETAISNPPFGVIRTVKDKKKFKYTGSNFEFLVIEQASRIADHGTFILPQNSVPFAYSREEGRPAQVWEGFPFRTSRIYDSFHEQTGIELDMNCGIDTTLYQKDWKFKTPVCEIALATFKKEQDASNNQSQSKRNSRRVQDREHTQSNAGDRGRVPAASSDAEVPTRAVRQRRR